ncbi:hypothetical protein [Streptomyces sp. NPDC088400]|uniref:hypothetical protein n=1 Tax=Streptomyces sp. NPDC088400 TaxID=3365861 RepID=UPI0037FFA286
MGRDAAWLLAHVYKLVSAAGSRFYIVIVPIVVGGVTSNVVAYFGLQCHRVGAVAMVSYRRRAEEAVALSASVRSPPRRAVPSLSSTAAGVGGSP